MSELTRLSPPGRRVLQIVSVVAILAGIAMLGLGMVGFLSSMGDFDAGPPVSSMALFAAGGFTAVVGLALARLAFLRPVSELVATETSDAVEHASGAVGRGLAGSGVGGTVVKVRCGGCGYLDTEDASFCSGCGQAM